jgi:hypothetical protein
MSSILGKKVKDVITGFTGIAIGYTRWLTGCSTVGIVHEKNMEVGKDGETPTTLWFDEDRVDVVGPGHRKRFVKEAAPLTGGPQPMPGRGRKHSTK